MKDGIVILINLFAISLYAQDHSAGITKPCAMGNTGNIIINKIDRLDQDMALMNRYFERPMMKPGFSNHDKKNLQKRIPSFSRPVMAEPSLTSTSEYRDDAIWFQATRRSPSEGYNYAVYDRKHKRMVTFGGAVMPDFSSGSFQVNSVHAMDFTLGEEAWYKIELTSGPCARWRHSLIYDSARERMIILGGRNINNVLLSDVWALDLTNIGQESWSQLSPTGTGPGPIADQIAIYDVHRNRMILFGSSMSSPRVLDFSTSANGQWTTLNPTGTPPTPRQGCVAAYDSLRDRVIVFGGYCLQNYCMKNDVFVLDFSSNPAGVWSELHPTGSAPFPRWGSGGVLLESEDYLLVFGGQDGSFAALVYNDAYVLDLNPTSGSWIELSPTGTMPQERFFPCFIHDAENGRAILYAGDTPYPFGAWGEYNCDAFALEIQGSNPINATWSRLAVSGETPRHSYGGTVIYDRTNQRMILCGGSDGFFVTYDDLYALHLDTPGAEVWQPLTCGGLERRDHVAVYDIANHRMVVFGGQVGNTDTTRKVHILDLSVPGNEEWQTLDLPGNPLAGQSVLCWSSAIYDSLNQRMILFGGERSFANKSSRAMNEVWSLNLTEGSESWAQLQPGGDAPPAAYGHSAIYDPIGQRMIVYCLGNYPNDLYALDLTKNNETWYRLQAQAAIPSNRNFHSAIYRRGEMIIFGGRSNSVLLNEVFSLDLSTLTWTEITTSGSAPQPTFSAGAIYDEPRDRMAVFGGGVNPDYWMINYTYILWNFFGITTTQSPVPLQPNLLEIAPNPFHNATHITYQVPEQVYATIGIYNSAGQGIKTLLGGYQQFGCHSVIWDGTDNAGRKVPSGVYLVKLATDEYSTIKKVLVIR